MAAIDGVSVTNTGSEYSGWPIKLMITPGLHTITLNAYAPANSIWDYWQGLVDVEYDFESGKSYLLRYRRKAKDKIEVWVDNIPIDGEISPNTVFCMQKEQFHEQDN